MVVWEQVVLAEVAVGIAGIEELAVVGSLAALAVGTVAEAEAESIVGVMVVALGNVDLAVLVVEAGVLVGRIEVLFVGLQVVWD